MRRKRDAQGLSDTAGDFLLHVKHILQFPVVPFGPEGEIGGGVHQLSVDAQAVSGTAQGASQDVSGVQVLTNLFRGGRLVAIRKNCGAGKHLEPFDFQKLGDDVFGHPVAEILVFFGAAEIFEVENRQRFLRARRRSCSTPRIGVMLQSRKVDSHAGGGLVPAFGILFHGLEDDRREFGRKTRIEPRGRSGRAVQNCVENHGRSIPRKCLAAGGHFIEHGAEGKKIGAMIEFRAARLFG